NASEKIGQVFTAIGGNYYITGRVTGHPDGSEEWTGIFDALEGYEVCNAYLDYGNMSITGESTFNTTVYRAGDSPPGLGFYAVVPKHKQTGQWIEAHLVIAYVPAGTSSNYACAAEKSHPWLCKGQNCNPLTRLR